MGQFEVEQRTKDAMFNATSLLKQWNENSGQSKEVTKFFELNNTKEFIKALLLEEKLNTQDCAYLKTRGKRGGTWMHPILFIKFAMWLNPRFEVQVIKFVYDQLIEHRHKAGDNYISLTASAATLTNVSYPQIAKGLNWIVFNKHEKNIRNTATEKQMNDLHLLEEKLAFAIDMGYIKSFEQLMSEMRKLYDQRNRKF